MNIENINLKKEILQLAEETLADIELSRLPLSNIALKASRLARLTSNLDLEKIFEYESGGYPMEKNGIKPEIWNLGLKANRISKNAEEKEVMSCYSLAVIENRIHANQIALEQTQDRNISLSTANPNQFLYSPPTNAKERSSRVQNINSDTTLLAERKAFIYSNIKRIYFDLKFSNFTESIWLKMKNKIDLYIREVIPDETQKLTAIYDSLNDDNPEKWATALTTCRRLLKTIADKLYPPSDVPIQKGKQKINIGEDNYINRLICYIEENSTHKTLDKITNSNIEYIGTRLDNIYNEACKGTHDTVEKEEAERCFMHVYMLIGDILEIVRQAETDQGA